MELELKVIKSHISLRNLLNIPTTWAVVKKEYDIELQEDSQEEEEYRGILRPPLVQNTLNELGLTIIPISDFEHIRKAEVKAFWRDYFTKAVCYDADGGKKSPDYKNLPDRLDEFFEYYSIDI